MKGEEEGGEETVMMGRFEIVREGYGRDDVCNE